MDLTCPTVVNKARCGFIHTHILNTHTLITLISHTHHTLTTCISHHAHSSHTQSPHSSQSSHTRTHRAHITPRHTHSSQSSHTLITHTHLTQSHSSRAYHMHTSCTLITHLTLSHAFITHPHLTLISHTSHRKLISLITHTYIHTVPGQALSFHLRVHLLENTC